MTVAQSILLTLQGLVFLAWAFMMFRTLFLFRRRNAEQSRAMFPGVGAFLRQAKYWLTSAEDQRDRRLLLALTLALFAFNFPAFLKAQ
ncbi:hypothetical protein [Gymnodinialimonas ceratoperidinii]|uniref:Uncharacterized protein n=1 Tax=Gymnodinialimonas ceratoperidinii TaxID=2856823 RepID=A0A8F6TXX1_9RHOB|nr:hypothetical protein [Gymnodinialimonas ceratoperidinii]QXT40204.1 hypothetical protein KYE46_02795 [Gymnodinialimonas ceratoperidinii]